jgi:hypothetical protein
VGHLARAQLAREIRETHFEGRPQLRSPKAADPRVDVTPLLRRQREQFFLQLALRDLRRGNAAGVGDAIGKPRMADKRLAQDRACAEQRAQGAQ